MEKKPVEVIADDGHGNEIHFRVDNELAERMGLLTPPPPMSVINMETGRHEEFRGESND